MFVGAFLHETNATSPIPTSRKSFEEGAWHRPVRGRPTETSRAQVGYGTIIKSGEAAGHTVFASTFAVANPSGRCTKEGYESIRDEILDDLRREGPFDMVFLFLHGAQMAVGYDDCEGDLLQRARDIIGDGPFLGAELDLHVNISSAMMSAADVLLPCKEYPHTDFNERAAELFELGVRFSEADSRPKMSFTPIPMLGLFYTTQPRMAALLQKIVALEGKDGIVSISLIHGFAWSNTPDAQAGVLIVSDAEGVNAELLGQEIAREFFDLRDETSSGRLSLDAVLGRISDHPEGINPLVIADFADNAGGGAASDSTFVLNALLERQLSGVAVGMIWDPQVATLAHDAGIGAVMPVRLGGKTGPLGGAPLDLVAKVVGLETTGVQNTLGVKFALGLTAALEVAGILVVVNSNRQQTTSPDCFEHLGIRLQDMRAIFVKSTQHFRTEFEPIASEILYCEAAGPLNIRSAESALSNVRRPIWPLDDVVSPRR